MRYQSHVWEMARRNKNGLIIQQDGKTFPERWERRRHRLLSPEVYQRIAMCQHIQPQVEQGLFRVSGGPRGWGGPWSPLHVWEVTGEQIMGMVAASLQPFLFISIWGIHLPGILEGSFLLTLGLWSIFSPFRTCTNSPVKSVLNQC